MASDTWASDRGRLPSEVFRYMIVAIFGIFIALSSMTTLRGERPVGLIDVGLIVFAALTVAISIVGRRRAERPGSGIGSNPVYIFLSLGLLALVISTLINVASYGAYFVDPVRTITPFIATCFCGIAMAVAFASGNALALLRSFAVASLFVGILYVAGALAGFGPFFYGPRFSGLSLNPNQTAMFALSAALVALVLLTKTPASKFSPIYVASFAFSMMIGVMTQSDAFMICAVLLIFCVAYLIAFRFTRSFFATVVLGAFAAVLAVALAAAFAPDLFGRSVDMVQASFSAGNQDSDRELLWKNGIAAWASRPIFGNGAGAWSGIGSPFQSVEAHNSFIDWLSMVGLVGTAPLVYCVVSVLRLNFKQHILSYVGVMALATFFLFHFVFRLPPIWLAWMALLAVFIGPDGALFPRPLLAAKRGSERPVRQGLI